MTSWAWVGDREDSITHSHCGHRGLGFLVVFLREEWSLQLRSPAEEHRAAVC